MNKQRQLVFNTKVLDEKNRIIEMIGSTEDYDRVGDKMLMSGVQLQNYLKNPVILQNHDYHSPAIGKSLQVKVSGSQLIFQIQFAETKDGQDWFYLYANKYMNASSIGFDPIEFNPNDKGGYDFTQWELLELSLVTVPCNPNAIQRAYKDGKISKSIYEAIREGETMQKGAIPYKKFPLSDEGTSWDGPAQIKDADTDTLKLICAWYDDKNPDVKGSYKLPHHMAEGNHETVWKGVVAAMGALLGAQGGVDIPASDKEAVYNHLAKHYKDFEKDPPEFHKSLTIEEGKDLNKEETQALINETMQPLQTEIKSLKENNEEKDKTIEALEGKIKELEKNPVAKAGAALSNANKQKLSEIHKSMSGCMDKLKEFIGDMGDEPDGDEGKGLEEPTEEEIKEISKLAAQEVAKILTNLK